jgi:hypothetical protein
MPAARGCGRSHSCFCSDLCAEPDAPPTSTRFVLPMPTVQVEPSAPARSVPLTTSTQPVSPSIPTPQTPPAPSPTIVSPPPPPTPSPLFTPATPVVAPAPPTPAPAPAPVQQTMRRTLAEVLSELPIGAAPPPPPTFNVPNSQLPTVTVMCCVVACNTLREWNVWMG